MILESDRAKLLLQLPENYNRPDGWLEINRCTIVIPYDGPAESLEQRRRQSIILQSPDGAVLKFDQPFDLNHFKVGRLGRRTIERASHHPQRLEGTRPGRRPVDRHQQH